MLLYTRLATPKQPKRRSRGGMSNAVYRIQDVQQVLTRPVSVRLRVLVSESFHALMFDLLRLTSRRS